MNTKHMGLKKVSAKELEEKGINVSAYAKELIDNLTFEELDNEIDCKVVTLAELGFTGSATWKEIMLAGDKQGLEPCAAMGPNFPFETLEKGDWFYIAMERITDSDGRPYVFTVKRYSAGEQWLYAYWAYPGNQWNLGLRIVFRLRKVTQDSETKPLTPGTLSLENLAARLHKLEEWKDMMQGIKVVEV